MIKIKGVIFHQLQQLPVEDRLLTLHLFDRLPWPSQKLDRLELLLIKTRPILLRCAEHLWCERSRWARR